MPSEVLPRRPDGERVQTPNRHANPLDAVLRHLAERASSARARAWASDLLVRGEPGAGGAATPSAEARRPTSRSEAATPAPGGEGARP
jgi:hypothetical protein